MGMNRTISADQLTKDDLQHFYDALNNSTPLVCVLVASSFISECLGVLLRAYFVDKPNVVNPMFERGVLGDFSKRTDIAYCVGLIGPMLMDNLDNIRKVRNHFAHKHFEATFDDPEVKALCDKLQFVRMVMPSSISACAEPITTESMSLQFSHPRVRFTSVSLMSANEIMLNLLSVKHCSERSDLTGVGVRVDCSKGQT